ncbi:MAG TPA: DUF3606 domain-containing protein [Vineibacter sp.]|nr:DUF3606 domain-containing protein [Vineibacter sp.]
MSRRQRQHDDALLDQALIDSFPASDPVAALQPGPLAERRFSKAKADMRSIDIDDAQEVRFWARELQADVAGIMDAVDAVGIAIEKIRTHIALAPRRR